MADPIAAPYPSLIPPSLDIAVISYLYSVVQFMVSPLFTTDLRPLGWSQALE